MDNLEILFERFNIDPSVGETKAKQLIRERYGDRMSEKQYSVLDERIHTYYREQRVAKLKALKERYHIVVDPRTLDEELLVHFPEMSEENRHALKVSLLELEGYELDQSFGTQKQKSMTTEIPAQKFEETSQAQETTMMPVVEEKNDDVSSMDHTQVMPSFSELQREKKSSVSTQRIQYLKANHKRMALFASVMLVSGVVGFVFVGRFKIVQMLLGGVQALAALASVIYVVKAFRHEQHLRPSMMFQWFVPAAVLSLIGSLPMMIPSAKVASLSLLFLGSAWLCNALVVLLSFTEKKYDDAYSVYKEIQ